MKNLLTIKSLDVSIGNKQILNNLNFTIDKNEIHILMGPNGSGKSTLSKVLTGHPLYKILKGDILLEKKNLSFLTTEIRAHEGIFLAFQYPLEISGITTFDFLYIIFTEKQKYLNQKEITPIEFLMYLDPLLKKLNIKEDFLKRNLNYGFSGGEKKRLEILQLLLLKPKLIILDEIDSGLDIDNIRLIYETILEYKEKDSSILLISHCPTILNYINPNFVHILVEGKLMKSTKKEIINEIQTYGYNIFSSEINNI